MSDDSRRQGFGADAADRLPLPPMEALNDEQRRAAQGLLDGPRKGVYGPFLPLLRSPALLERVASLGEYLRFGSVLGDQVRELCICAAARHVHNQFEWRMHAPLARKAGVDAAALEALRQGARVAPLGEEAQCALDFTQELLRNHGVSDASWQACVQRFGEQGAVELATLAGYFVMVSWVMNAARTPALATSEGPGLEAFPL